MDMLEPTNVEPRDGYCIWIEFNDGVCGEVDLADLAGKGACIAWKDREFFEQVRIDGYGDLVWSDDVVIEPEPLYAALLGISVEELDARWEAAHPARPLLPHPTRVEPREGFRIWLEFSDGASGEVDLSHLAGKGVFQAWDDRKFFEQVSLDDYPTVTWPGEIDLCPETLYVSVTGIQTPEVRPQVAAPP